MVRCAEILQAILRAQSFLKGTQQPDGSWSEETKRKEPEHLQTELVSTAQGLQTLVHLASPELVPFINRAAHFCLLKELTDKDSAALWAWKLLALTFFDAPTYKKVRSQMASHIKKQQALRGCWRCFPSTSNLTNFYALLALRNSKEPHVFERAINWFWKTKATDGFGWGYDEKAQKSEVSFTANAVLSLLFSGEDATSEELQAVKSFLEKKQFKEGSWHASSLTIPDKPTVYATALATWCLIYLSENPFNPCVEKAVKFLLNAQLPDGGWPLVPREDKKSRYYTTYYAVKILSLYAFLKKEFGKREIKTLGQKLERPQFLTSHLAEKFERIVKNRFRNAVKNHILNSRILGSTPKAVARRRDILRILNESGEKAIAELIDELKKLPQYAELSKKSHSTQIKADMDYLRSLNIVSETDDYKYYVTLAIF